MEFVLFRGQKIYLNQDYSLNLPKQSIEDLQEIKGLEELKTIRALHLDNNNISKINRLNNLKKLKVLSLRNNKIEIIEGLDNLEELEELYLSGNPIKDLQGFNCLINLKHLYIERCGIRCIEGLDNLKNLENLWLGDNKIVQIKGLDNLEKLQNLSLVNNQITEICGLDNLNNLIILDMRENKISTISGLQNLYSLKEIRLENNKIPHELLFKFDTERWYSNEAQIYVKYCRKEYVEFSGKFYFIVNNHLHISNLGITKLKEVKGFNNVTEIELLNLTNNEIEEIDSIQNLINLKKLWLGFNRIKEIKNIESLTKLEELSLTHNNITNLQGLRRLKNLKILKLKKNEIRDLTGIESLSNLSCLDLSNNPNLENISILSNLNSLERLYLKNINIKDLSILSKLKKLILLDLSGNRLDFIPRLDNYNLKSLDLSNNNIKSMDSLCQFPNLEYLNLNENQIEELNCIDKMKFTLNKFYIDNNNLSLEKDQIDKLKIPEKPLYPNENNSRRFILYILLRNYFDTKQAQNHEEIEFDKLINDSPILQKLQNMKEYPYVRDIVKMFKKDYEIRVAPNKIPQSIVTPKKIAQEIENKILKFLVPGKDGYPLDEIVTEHNLGNKKAVKRLLRIIKDKELTKIPFIFTDTEIRRAPEAHKVANTENDKKTIDLMSYLLECFNAPNAIKRRDGDPQIEQLAHFILGKYSTSKEKITIVDIGAGYGDLLKAIHNSGIASKINYFPIEIDKGKWSEIEGICKSIDNLEYTFPSENINSVKRTDIIFFINVFHELSLDQRVDFLYESLKLIQNRGLILIHEVIVLPKLESNFFMWDADDFKLIMSKINSKIEIEAARTYSRPNGWPLHSIMMTYNNEKLITKKEIRSAIISSLREIKQKWLNYKESEDFIKIEDETMKKRVIAFIMAQNMYIDSWIKDFLL